MNLRRRLEVTPLEDRTVPSTVTIESLGDATEDGTAGTIRLTRDGSTANALTVYVTISGTATLTTDYSLDGVSSATNEQGTVYFVVIPANASSVDVSVEAAADRIYDPDETVGLAIGPGSYTIGDPSSATVTIADDIDAVETLIHSESFQLTGSNGNVDVTLTVTYNAEGAEGQYTWTYLVSNPSQNTTYWTDLRIPVDNTDGLGDVGNLSSSIGWTGTVGDDEVSWTKGSASALAPGASATFSFTTDPREVGGATVAVSASGGSQVAQLPTAPAPRRVAELPRVNLAFPAGAQSYSVTLEMTTADGQTHTAGAINVFLPSAEAARDQVYNYLKDSDWSVRKLGTDGIEILGFVNPNGTFTAIKSLTNTVTNWTSGTAKPVATGTGQVQVTNN